MYETAATAATDGTSGVAAEEPVSQLQVDLGVILKAKTLTLTDQAQGGTSAQSLCCLISKLIVLVRKSHASAVYEDVALPLPPTKKATVGSDSQRTRCTQAAAGTAAEVAAATTTDVAVNLVWTVGHMTEQTTIAVVGLLVVDVGRRTLLPLKHH
jgi:hypothetical protein